MATSSTSPANMFPKSRKVKLMMRAISLIPSSMPTNSPMGPLLKLMNLPTWPKKPSVLSPPEVNHDHRHQGDSQRRIYVGVGAPQKRNEEARLLALLHAVLLEFRRRNVGVDGAERQYADESVAVEDLKIDLSETDVLLLRVVDDLLRRLQAADSAESGEYAHPVSGDDEQEDRHHEGGETASLSHGPTLARQGRGRTR